MFAAIPALSNLAGGVIAEFMPVSKRTLSLALHLATGIVIGVVGLELAPEAFEASPLVVPILAFTGGGIVFLAFEHVTDKHLVSSPEDSGAWSVFGAVSLDLFSDGVMIGTATLIDPTLGLLLAIGQAPADLPEGFAAVATFKGTRMTRRRRLGLALAFAIPIVLGATIGYWALRPAPFLVQASVLALTGGTLLAVVIEEVIPQAHQEVDSRFAAGMVVVGFALFALLLHPPRCVKNFTARRARTCRNSEDGNLIPCMSRHDCVAQFVNRLRRSPSHGGRLTLLAGGRDVAT